MLGVFNLLGGSGEPAPDADREMVSLVVLYRDYVELSLESLREILNEVFPGQFLPPGDASFVIEGPVPDATFMIKCAVQGMAGLFMLNNVPAPYTEFSDFAEFIVDPVMRELAESQSAWLSIDLIGQSAAEDAYRFIAKVLARLAPNDAAFLVHPDTGAIIPFDENLRRALADGRQPFGAR